MKKLTKKEKIKQDLLDQIERAGIFGRHYLDLVDDYISLWEIKNKLIADSKKNPYTEWQNSETSFGRKKNDSIDQALKVNQQMIKIMDFLGIKPSKQDGDSFDDEEM